MKMTVVPAQVTTVEDRIIGSLGFSQILLLVIPIFLCAGIFAVAPPFMAGALYKYIIMSIVVGACAILAIRIKGNILALWMITLLRYNVRPKFYLFNKNTRALRKDYAHVKEETATVKQEDIARKTVKAKQLDTQMEAGVRRAIDNPETKFRIVTGKKGELRVRLTKIKEEGE